MGEMKSLQMGVIGALFLSVASSVSIVICNKALMSNLGFPFGNYYFFLNCKLKSLSKLIIRLIFGRFSAMFLICCSNDTNKLAFDGNILHTSCGI